jgi:capsular exopolysaccharide synthesis family protein
MRRELIVQRSPKSPVAEVFRTLRTNIQFMNSKKSLKTLLITSTMPGEGKTWVSSNLAITFAQADKKVVIVDADMRKGRLHTMFQIDPVPGLSNYLSGINGSDNADEDILKYVKPTEVENLYVVPSGNIPPNPSELLASEATTNMLERLKEVFDVVILDGTPSLLVTDAIILSREADTTIIVTSHKTTKKDGLQKVKRAIENVGGKIAGVVINKIPVNIEKYESTYYYSSSSKDERNSNNYKPQTTGKISKEKSDDISRQLDEFLKNNKN